jgi:Abnormal spindle-like microcephaly-assoc'd, ASPM-SPD-2-Hydin
MTGEFNRGGQISAKHPLSTSGRSMCRSVSITALLLSLIGMLSISGCTGATSATKSSGQQTQNSAAPATISMAPSSITFGSVAVGGTVSQSVSLSNSGGSDLTITQVSTAASGVTITGESFPMTIPAGSQSNFNVVFSPKAAGAVSGTVSVVSSVSTSPGSVAIAGTGVAATTLLNASTSSLSFGNVSAGTSSTLGVTLSNAGNSNVTISSVSLTGTSVTTSGVGAGLILAPGQSATLNVVYSPLAAGNLTGSVTVASNATNSPDSIALSGTGVKTASHSVSLSWAASTSVVASYNVYRAGASTGPYVKQNSSAVAAIQYTDSTVQAGQTYYYEVTSVTSGGVESTGSANISATIPTT